MAETLALPHAIECLALSRGQVEGSRLLTPVSSPATHSERVALKNLITLYTSLPQSLVTDSYERLI